VAWFVPAEVCLAAGERLASSLGQLQRPDAVVQTIRGVVDRAVHACLGPAALSSVIPDHARMAAGSEGVLMSNSRWRGFFAVVALVAAVVVAGVPAASATVRPTIDVSGGLTQPVFSYQDAIREYVRVQSPVDSDGDGKKDLVRVDIIRPKETSSGLKVPVIMHESPYFDEPGAGFENDHKTYDANGNPTKFPLFYDNYFVPRGYAFVSVDMIGTRLSDGCPTSGGPSDVLGGKAVIDWLNGRAIAYDANGKPVKATWTTGHTGMIGHSYEGGLAVGVAGTGVPGLDTIVPLAGTTSWYDQWRVNGTRTWFTGGQEWLAKRVDLDPDEKCAAVYQRMTEGEDDATGNYNAYWHELDYRTGPVSNVRNMRASVFAVMGMQDRNVRADQFSQWWAGLPRGVRRKVWLTQYGHLDPFWARRDVWINTLHRWFDHELMGVPNDIMRQPHADVQLGPDRWITQADWPAPTRTATLRPQHDGSLGTAPSAGTGSYTETLRTEATMAGDPGTPQQYRLAFLTPPLKNPTRLSGTPSVTLQVTLNKPTANLGVLLVDYGQDTRVDYADPGQGLQFVDGEDCVGESTADDDGCYRRAADKTVTSGFEVVTRGIMDAQNHESLSNPTPLIPGKSYQITWSMLPQDYEFKSGHRLGLVLTGTDDDLTDAETGTGTRVTVHLAGTSVSLPVAAGKIQPN
jgi:X-Pro dipeptidyl-peptidase